MPENDEPRSVEEFLNDLGRVEHDDALLDVIGQGYDVKATGDQAVVDLLSAWEQAITTEPSLDVANRAERGERSPGSTLRPVNTGGTVSSVQENASELNGMPDSFPYEVQQSVATHFERLGTRIKEILGDGHGANQTLQEGVNLVMSKSNDAYTAMEQLQQQLRDAAARLQQGG